MLSWHDYDIRVWGDGDVNINSCELLGFGQLSGASGIQCNTCDESKKEDIRKACMDVANAMRALDALVEGGDDGDGC